MARFVDGRLELVLEFVRRSLEKFVHDSGSCEVDCQEDTYDTATLLRDALRGCYLALAAACRDGCRRWARANKAARERKARHGAGCACCEARQAVKARAVAFRASGGH